MTPAHAHTPQPLPGASTGAPIARTFGGRPPGVKSKAPMVAVAAGGFVVLAVGVVGLSFLVKGKSDSPVTGAAMGSGDQGHSRASLVDAMVAEPHAAATAVVAVLPVETVSSAPVAVVAPPSAPAPRPQGKATPANPPPARPPAGVNAPPPAKPSAPAPPEKKKPVDLGI